MTSQRKLFAQELEKWMEKDDKIWVLTGDLGFGMWDSIKDKFPARFINTGAAEQSLLDISVGLAQSGHKPFVYSITPFLLWRAAETIRLYINQEKTPVKLIGGGRNTDYAHDGFSHDASDDKQLMRLFPNIISCWPDDNDEVVGWVESMVTNSKPYYLNLRR